MRVLLAALQGLLPVAVLGALPSQEDTPAGRTHYMGREIARTMHYNGAPWLVRSSRERQEECSTLLRELRVEPGSVVCDLGCGNGFYTLELARMVGATGKVIAVDIQKQMLDLLRLRARDTDLADRIEPVLCTVSDPKLPANGVDLVVMVDVYHELSHPVSVLRAIHRSLRPGGRIVLAEFRQEDPKVPIKPRHKMSKRQILREIAQNGFKLVRQYDGLPWQHLMFFTRAEQDPAAEKARAGLRAAADFAKTLSVRGGYAGIYSLDLTERHGESLHEKAGPTEIWVQPPGTPSVGRAFLRAFRLTGEDVFYQGARDAGRALAWGQRSSGGWDHRVDVGHLTPAAKMPVRAAGHCTFDDDISQGALSFLIELGDVVNEPWLRESIELGVKHLLAAQFDNGAWPQWYPLRGGYHDHFTFNDRAINDCIRTALLAHQRLGRKDCLLAARRGGGFIAGTQGKAPQQGWAQQYSHDLQPAAARAFEPAGMCSAVTANNIRTLIELALYTGEEGFLEPIPAALDWLARAKLADGRWARLYELGTNRPIYGDRDGKVHYTLAELSAERRRGYAWQGSWGASLPGEFDRLRSLGIAAFKADRTRRELESRPTRGARARTRAEPILADFEANAHRWIRNGRIHIADLVRNLDTLCDCLALQPK